MNEIYECTESENQEIKRRENSTSKVRKQGGQKAGRVPRDTAIDQEETHYPDKSCFSEVYVHRATERYPDALNSLLRGGAFGFQSMPQCPKLRLHFMLNASIKKLVLFSVSIFKKEI